MIKIKKKKKNYESLKNDTAHRSVCRHNFFPCHGQMLVRIANDKNCWPYNLNNLYSFGMLSTLNFYINHNQTIFSHVRFSEILWLNCKTRELLL